MFSSAGVEQNRTKAKKTKLICSTGEQYLRHPPFPAPIYVSKRNIAKLPHYPITRKRNLSTFSFARFHGIIINS